LGAKECLERNQRAIERDAEQAIQQQLAAVFISFTSMAGKRVISKTCHSVS